MTSHKPIDNADYMYIGLGAANCLLILKMHENGLFVGKTIVVIEPKENNLNERNFCFWSTEKELQELGLGSLINAQWGKIKVAGLSPQSIKPLYYFHIKAFDLSIKVIQILKEYNTTYYKETFAIESINDSKVFVFELNDKTITADTVFAGRPPKYKSLEKNQIHLLQSFYGWKIIANDYTFNQSTMVKMDFDIPQNNFCQFMDVFPFDANTSLFEVTRFGKEKISKDEAEKILKEYLSRYDFSYQILEEENGLIPMSSAIIHNTNLGKNWFNTGANANMVKPTTGYALHNMALAAQKITESLVSQTNFSRSRRKSRFKCCDGLLLKILEEKPQLGKQIFQNLFKGIDNKNVLNFLGGRSSFTQELIIFSKLPLFIILRLALKDVQYRISKISPTSIAFTLTMMMVFLSYFDFEKILYLPLIVGFFTIGLSHGALDHLTNERNNGFKQLFKFVTKYIAKAVIFGLVWIFLTDLALIIFFIFSAWHFGQADFREWKLKDGLFSFLWGNLVLALILIFHLNEVAAFLENIKGLQLNHASKGLTENSWLMARVMIIFLTLMLVTFYKSKQMLITLFYILLSSVLPLMVSFGIYFIIQHSFHGWRHLKSALKTNSFNLYRKALPFSLGGALIILLFLANNISNDFSLFFILLSCMSLPHVISMNRFYFRFNRN